MVEKTDQQLISETLNGRLASFEILLKRYQPKIYRHTKLILHDPADAEDATQMTFIKVFMNIKKFKLDKPFSPWLYKIATNYCYDMLRQEPLLLKLDEEMEVETDSPTPLDEIIKHEDVGRLRAALSKLPSIYLKPILGFYFSDLNYQSLAKVLDLPVNTIRTRLRRGKLMLRNTI